MHHAHMCTRHAHAQRKERLANEKGASDERVPFLSIYLHNALYAASRYFIPGGTFEPDLSISKKSYKVKCSDFGRIFFVLASQWIHGPRAKMWPRRTLRDAPRMTYPLSHDSCRCVCVREVNSFVVFKPADQNAAAGPS